MVLKIKLLFKPLSFLLVEQAASGPILGTASSQTTCGPQIMLWTGTGGSTWAALGTGQMVRDWLANLSRYFYKQLYYKIHFKTGELRLFHDGVQIQETGTAHHSHANIDRISVGERTILYTLLCTFIEILMNGYFFYLFNFCLIVCFYNRRKQAVT